MCTYLSRRPEFIHACERVRVHVRVGEGVGVRLHVHAQAFVCFPAYACARMCLHASPSSQGHVNAGNKWALFLVGNHGTQHCLAFLAGKAPAHQRSKSCMTAVQIV